MAKSNSSREADRPAVKGSVMVGVILVVTVDDLTVKAIWTVCANGIAIQYIRC
jgi:hypothetical protein